MSTTENNIFLCHTRSDKDFVRRLATDLDKLQVAVWLDEWELGVGDSLHRCIGKALCEAAYIGVVLSPDSIDSRWCQDELEQGLAIEKRSDRTIVLPIICRPVQPPPFLEGRVYLDFTDAYYPSLTHLGGFVLNARKGALLRRIAECPPTSLHDCLSVLADCGHVEWSNIGLRDQDYREIREILGRYGIHIPRDVFGVSTRGADVIICDMALGETGSGLELLKAVREIEPDEGVELLRGWEKQLGNEEDQREDGHAESDNE